MKSGNVLRGDSNIVKRGLTVYGNFVEEGKFRWEHALPRKRFHGLYSADDLRTFILHVLQLDDELPMNSTIVQALVIYAVAGAISFFVAGLIKVMYTVVRMARKEEQ
jgi:hypothetical protein